MRRKKVKNENSRPETSGEKKSGIQKVRQYIHKNKILLAIIGCLFVYIFAANGTVADALDERESQVAQLQTDYDSLLVENQSLKEENENLSGQISSLQEQSVSANTVSAVSEGSTSGSGGDGGTMVWLSATGSKYHSIPDCGNMNPNKARQVSKSSAEAQGYGACSKCW